MGRAAASSCTARQPPPVLYCAERWITLQSLRHPSCLIQSLGTPCRITPCPRKRVNKTNMCVWRKCRAHLRVQKIFGVSLKIGVSVSKGVLGTAVEAAAARRRGTRPGSALTWHSFCPILHAMKANYFSRQLEFAFTSSSVYGRAKVCRHDPRA